MSVPSYTRVSVIELMTVMLQCLAELKQAIERDFGSLENMQNQLSAATVAVQGSGWGWLGFNKQTGHLQLATTFNQDMLEPTLGTALQ